MKTNNKKTIFATILFLVFLGSAIYLRIDNVNSKNELFQLRNNIKTQESIPEKIFIERKIETLNTKTNNLKKYFFDADSPVIFIQKVEEIAIENNVEVMVEDVNSQSIDENSFSNLTMSVSATGNLEDIRVFIDELESMREIVVINNIRLTKVLGENGEYWRTIFNLSANTK